MVDFLPAIASSVAPSELMNAVLYLRAYLIRLIPCCDPHQRLLARPGHFRRMLGDHHVDFRSDSERRRIDARFDGKARTCDESTVVVGFIVVHVDPVPVHFLAKTVAGPVDEELPEPGLGDDVARHAIHLKPPDRLARGNPVLYLRDAGIAAGHDRRKGTRDFV